MACILAAVSPVLAASSHTLVAVVPQNPACTQMALVIADIHVATNNVGRRSSYVPAGLVLGGKPDREREFRRRRVCVQTGRTGRPRSGPLVSRVDVVTHVIGSPSSLCASWRR